MDRGSASWFASGESSADEYVRHFLVNPGDFAQFLFYFILFEFSHVRLYVQVQDMLHNKTCTDKNTCRSTSEKYCFCFNFHTKFFQLQCQQISIKTDAVSNEQFLKSCFSSVVSFAIWTNVKVKSTVRVNLLASWQKTMSQQRP